MSFDSTVFSRSDVDFPFDLAEFDILFHKLPTPETQASCACSGTPMYSGYAQSAIFSGPSASPEQQHNFDFTAPEYHEEYNPGIDPQLLLKQTSSRLPPIEHVPPVPPSLQATSRITDVVEPQDWDDVKMIHFTSSVPPRKKGHVSYQDEYLEIGSANTLMAHGHSEQVDNASQTTLADGTVRFYDPLHPMAQPLPSGTTLRLYEINNKKYTCRYISPCSQHSKECGFVTDKPGKWLRHFIAEHVREEVDAVNRNHLSLHKSVALKSPHATRRRRCGECCWMTYIGDRIDTPWRRHVKDIHRDLMEKFENEGTELADRPLTKKRRIQ